MFSSIDLPESNFLTTLQELGRDLDEFKLAQFTGGDSIQTVSNQTSSLWDVDTTIPSTAGITWWEVIFTPDDAKLGFIQLGFDYLVTPDSGFEFFTSYPSPRPDPPGGLGYIVEYSNPNLTAVNVKLKFSVRSFSTGSLSWSIVRQTA